MIETLSSTAMTSRSQHCDAVLAALQASTDPLTVPELADRTGRSEVTVRRHIRQLVDERRAQFVANLPSYDERHRLRWGRGLAQYAPCAAAELV